MKNILLIHRYYKTKGGEDVFFDNTLLPALALNKNYKIDVLKFKPINNVFEIFFMFLGLEYLRPSYREVKRKINNNKYDVVFLNNFIPTLSLKIPELLSKYNIKTFIWVHNARSICANGLVFDGKNECYACLNKSSFFAFKNNCNKSIFQSLVYSVIYRNNRVIRLLSHVPLHFLAVSKYAASFIEKSKLLNLSHNKLDVIYLPTPITLQEEPLEQLVAEFIKKFNNKFYLYAGRLSFEKGVDRIVDLAMKHPQKAFVISGMGPMQNVIESKISQSSIKNIILTHSSKNQLNTLYKLATAIIIPSRVKETFSLVIAESQPYNTPIVYPAGGGAEEAVRYFQRTAMKFEDFHCQDINNQQPASQTLGKIENSFTDFINNFS